MTAAVNHRATQANPPNQETKMDQARPAREMTTAVKDQLALQAKPQIPETIKGNLALETARDQVENKQVEFNARIRLMHD